MQQKELIEYFKGKVSRSALNKLKSLDENTLNQQAESLRAIPLKNKWIGFLLGAILGWFWIFGVDRFYKGDKILGILKILFTLQVYLFSLLAPLILPFSLEAGKGFITSFWSGGISGVISLVMDLINLDLQSALNATVFYAKVFAYLSLAWLFSMIVGFIWIAFDPILVFFGIKRDNSRKLLAAISGIQTQSGGSIAQ